MLWCSYILQQVSSGTGKGMEDMEPYYPLKEGEEAHWEVRDHMTDHMIPFGITKYF